MARVGFQDSRCPRFLATEGIKRLNGRWKTPILSILGEGPLRYAEIKRALLSISDKMLAQQLHALEADGLIVRREVVNDPPKTVEYQLTALGESVRPVLTALAAFGELVSPLATASPDESRRAREPSS